MCAIFGVLDYKGQLGPAKRLQMVKALGNAAEVRGTDATGIAFFQRDKLCIQKALQTGSLSLRNGTIFRQSTRTNFVIPKQAF